MLRRRSAAGALRWPGFKLDWIAASGVSIVQLSRMVNLLLKPYGWASRISIRNGLMGLTKLRELVTSGGVLAWLQAGRSPGYLRTLALGVLVLAGLALLVATVTGQVRL